VTAQDAARKLAVELGLKGHDPDICHCEQEIVNAFLAYASQERERAALAVRALGPVDAFADSQAAGWNGALEAAAAAIRALPGALLVRMSGSGATCFGIFADEDCCRRAAESLRQSHPDWWVAPTTVPESGIMREAPGQDIGPTPDGL
jgi:hypothetical protein